MAIDELAPPRPQGERMSILGIDPGKSGAVAVLDEGGENATGLSNAMICAIPNKAQQGQSIIFASTH